MIRPLWDQPRSHWLLLGKLHQGLLVLEEQDTAIGGLETGYTRFHEPFVYLLGDYGLDSSVRCGPEFLVL
jgi:hypothetical protein